MFTKPTLNLINIMVLLLASSQSWCKELLLNGEEIAVEDGDTLLITIEGAEERIQLIDIDAPEDVENAKFKLDLRRTGLDHDTLYSLGVIASNHMAKLLSGEGGYRLSYEPERRDRYGRLLGDLTNEAGVSLGRQMITDGYAIAKPSQISKRPHPYETLQLQAVEKKMGLWGLLPEQTRLWSGAAAAQ